MSTVATDGPLRLDLQFINRRCFSKNSVHHPKEFKMTKLLATLVAAFFSVGVFAQATPATPATPAAKAEKKEEKAAAKTEKKADKKAEAKKDDKKPVAKAEAKKEEAKK
ncbi:MAG: hypothetical protein AB7E83_11235 [Ramlibacter sp.]